MQANGTVKIDKREERHGLGAPCPPTGTGDRLVGGNRPVLPTMPQKGPARQENCCVKWGRRSRRSSPGEGTTEPPVMPWPQSFANSVNQEADSRQRYIDVQHWHQRPVRWHHDRKFGNWTPWASPIRRPPQRGPVPFRHDGGHCCSSASDGCRSSRGHRPSLLWGWHTRISTESGRGRTS